MLSQRKIKAFAFLSDLEQIHLTCRRPKVDGVAVFVAKLCVVFPSRIEIVGIVVRVDVIYSPTVTISLYFIRITFFTVKCDIEIIVVYSCGIVHHRHIFITVCRCEKAYDHVGVFQRSHIENNIADPFLE